ncbi:hypothetical protein DFP72DRAFT_459644 [Ephemerocybe angulata]|uniref:Ubiquitin-like domain-containing protein n=1 Tax=Ephemerocybe angulata TaxID=980116 RepID=A0A8H6HTW7_9AGAR|nr:hypothetical protein DFP72DRAFT_459644 [Tulosesus angulatus]
MWRALVIPFRSRWKGRKGAERLEPITPRMVPPQLSSEPTSYTAPMHPPLEPITPRMVPPQLSSEPTSYTAPMHPPLEPTLYLAPTQHPPEHASFSALSQPLPEHDLCLVPTHPFQEPGSPPTQSASEPTLFGPHLAPQFFGGSSNNSFGSVAITTVQGNMIIHQNDYDELRRAIATEIRRSIAAIVRHSNENALVLTDALGETLTIPWSFVPTYKGLRRLLVTHFKDKLGEKRVAEGRYCIGRAEGPDDGLVVEAQHWDSIRDQHEQLVMSMLIEQELDVELDRMCPKCGRTELGTYVDQGWRVCRRCGTRFMLPGLPKVADETSARVEDPGEVLQFRHVQKQAVMTVCTVSLDC